MKSTKLMIFFLTAFSILIGINAAAQEKKENSIYPIYNGKDFLFKGRPQKYCKSFMIYETGLLQPISGKRRNDDFVGIADLGVMNNINSNTAVGASICLFSNDQYIRFGIRPRFKKWLNRDVSIDLSAGFFFNSQENLNSGGFMLGSSVSFAELMSIDFFYHRYNSDSRYNPYYNTFDSGTKETVGTLYMGMTGRSYGGLVVQAGCLVALLVVLSSWDMGGSYGF